LSLPGAWICDSSARHGLCHAVFISVRYNCKGHALVSFFLPLPFLSFFIFQPAFPSYFPSFCLCCLPLSLSFCLPSVQYNFLCLLPSFFFLPPYNFLTAYPSIWIRCERCRVEATCRQFNSRCSFAYLYLLFDHVRTHYYFQKHSTRNFKIMLRLRTMHHIQTQQDVSATGSVSFFRLKNVGLNAHSFFRYQKLSQSLDKKNVRYIFIKVKVKFTPKQSLKSQRGLEV